MTVYMIQANPSRRVKIGHSAYVEGRLALFQCANPEELRVLRLFEGDQPEEALLHWRFRKQRIRGEWFDFSDDMLGELSFNAIALERAASVGNSSAKQPKEPTEYSVGPFSTLREIMVDRGLRQAAVAAQLGISNPNLSKMAWRKQTIPTRLIRPLAVLLDVSADAILDVALPLEATEESA